MTLVVETRDLEKTYMQGKVPVHALRGINFTVEEGELVAILGPSGSGKSTLLNMIGALDLPTGGTAIIGGKNISQLNKNQLAELRRQIGFVFQYFNLIARLTAFQNVEIGLSIQGKSKSERRQKVEEILTSVGLKDRMHHKPAELSGGEHQRVAIARALAQEPKFLLMDEPTGNVDAKTGSVIMDLVSALNREQKITTIIVTHDHEIAKKTDRTVYIVDGKLANNSSTETEEFNGGNMK